MNRYLWLIGILLAVVVFSPAPGESRAMAALHDFAHAPVFGVVCWLSLAWLQATASKRNWSVGAQYAVAISASIVLGLATEAAQRLAGGDSAWIDLWADTLGAFAFAGFFAIFDRRVTSQPLKAFFGVIGVLALIWHTLPLIRTARAYAARNADFPVLLDATKQPLDLFLEPIHIEREQRALPPEYARYVGEQAMRIGFVRGTWPGLQIIEPVADWRAFATLAVEVTNVADAPIRVSLRVHDRTHNNEHDDRFNRSFPLAARTRTTIKVPLAEIRSAPKGREMDLSQMESVVLFAQRDQPVREVFLSRIWLQHDH